MCAGEGLSWGCSFAPMVPAITTVAGMLRQVRIVLGRVTLINRETGGVKGVVLT